MAVKEDLTHKQFGNWVIIEELGGGKVLCECQCENKTQKILYKKSVKNGQTKSCGCLSNRQFIDITGQKFWHWTVLEELGNRKVLCQCDCESKTIRELYKKALKEGKTKSCGCARSNICEETKKQNGTYDKRYTKYKGQKFGELTVVGKSEKDGKVTCICDCSPDILREFWISHLVNGTTKSCGHNKTVDLTNKQFGNWIVKKELGEGKVLVQCQCKDKTTKVIFKSSLLNGRSKSCGCQRTENCQKTMLDKYGELCTLKIDNPREAWQIEVINNKNKFIDFLESLGYKPTIKDLSEMLCVNKASAARAIKKYSAEEYINLLQAESYAEIELINYIKSIYNGKIIKRDKSAIAPLEIDIYLPDLKLGIEFNGTYWHSTEFKSKNYHRDKSVVALNNGIRIIHIFEYEWEDKETKNKIMLMLKSIISGVDNVIYARNCELRRIDAGEAKQFVDNNHIQRYTTSSINIGLYHKDNIVMIMTFDKSRFNNNSDYELIRLCTKINTKIVGGASKLFKHFINTYNPKSVIAYSDLTKFIGKVYAELGFNIVELTAPNYVWCDGHSKLTRYQTMKKKLIEKDLGTVDQTEDEIMYNLGFFKIYNSGNLKYLWKGDK